MVGMTGSALQGNPARRRPLHALEILDPIDQILVERAERRKGSILVSGKIQTDR